MSGLAPQLLRGLTGPARQLLVQRAQVHSRPPREPFGATDVVVGLTACFLCFLVPPAWVLANLESYKKREE